MSNGLGDGQHHVVILGFESHNHSVQPLMIEGLEICNRHGGEYTLKGSLTKEIKLPIDGRSLFFRHLT